MSAISIIIALLENLPGIENSIGNTISYLVNELQMANSNDYRCMLCQGLCMALLTYTAPTLVALESTGNTFNVINEILNQTTNLKQDFEVKRFTLGLAGLIQKDVSELPPSIHGLMPQFIQRVAELCDKSVFLKFKAHQKEQVEQAEDAQDAEIIEEDDDIEILSDEDDDEDYNQNDDLEGDDLYEGRFDNVDEVIYFSEMFQNLQQSNPNMYNNYLNCLNDHQ